MVAERKRTLTCAIYTRKSSEEGLEQDFNSLDAQREACAAYIQSQRNEGWTTIQTGYDDGGFSGGSMERPALKQLLTDIDDGKVDVVVVYKVDRLTRSLADFAKIVETFDQHGVSFVSVTQQFNTTSSMGRLTLNVLLSFAQFEREVTGERIRDKFAASRRKGMWMGGLAPLGYDGKDHKLLVNEPEAETVRMIFLRYTALGCVAKLKAELDQNGISSKVRVSQAGNRTGGRPFSRGALYDLLRNRAYLGDAVHKDKAYPGAHEAIIDLALWEQAQQTLSGNRQSHTSRDRSKEPSLLSGLLFDDRGNRLSPSHVVKHSKRYRYYVSQAVLQNRKQRAGSAVRLPAHEVELLVGRQLTNLLNDQATLAAAVQKPVGDCNDLATLLAAAQQRAQSWFDAQPAEIRSFVRTVVTQVVIGADHVEIQVSKARESAGAIIPH